MFKHDCRFVNINELLHIKGSPCPRLSLTGSHRIGFVPSYYALSLFTLLIQKHPICVSIIYAHITLRIIFRCVLKRERYLRWSVMTIGKKQQCWALWQRYRIENQKYSNRNYYCCAERHQLEWAINGQLSIENKGGCWFVL